MYRPIFEDGKLNQILKGELFGKICQIDEIKMVRPCRENTRGKNATTSTPCTYYRSKKMGRPT